MRRSIIFSTLLASVFFIFFAAPASATALEKTVVTFRFDDSMEPESRITFIDSKFDDYVDSELTGRLVGGIGPTWVILEGNGGVIEGEIDELMADDRAQNVQVVSETSLNKRTYEAFETHSELDPRGNAGATASSSLARAYVRVKFASGVNGGQKVKIVDEYFNDFANDGLGGMLVGGIGPTWMPVEIEGSQIEVESQIMDMKEDGRFASVTVLRFYEPSSQTLPRLWSHSSEDVRESSQ